MIYRYYIVLNAFPETLVVSESNHILMSSGLSPTIPTTQQHSTWDEATGGMDREPVHGAHGLSTFCIHDLDQIHVIVLGGAIDGDLFDQVPLKYGMNPLGICQDTPIDLYMKRMFVYEKNY